ncbi:type IV secretion system DNA-binding domain-containing protein [[Mycoplasma] testudinis]|uniref:type IV secretion system DNA-binding domain-containing protein n=1 Tax=[Mycoplasma] testudinis TaxID=33924 RepID=UPI0006978C62|nr:TraM recognition domain-containing protein [[Mycoplasma] testudinis]
MTGVNIALNFIALMPLVLFAGFGLFFTGHFATRKFFYQVELKEIQKRNLLLENETLDKSYFEEKNRKAKIFFFTGLYRNLQKKLSEIVDPAIKGIKLNQKVIIPDEALKQPVSVVGATGFGKTTTLLHFLKYAFEENIPAIFIDGKGDQNLIKDLCLIGKENNLKINTWSIEGNLGKQFNEVAYNPFKNKTDNQIVSLLMEMQGYSESVRHQTDATYYRQIEKAIFDLVVPVLSKLKISIDFVTLTKYTNKENFKNLVTSRSSIRRLRPEIHDYIFQMLNEVGESINQILVQLLKTEYQDQKSDDCFPYSNQYFKFLENLVSNSLLTEYDCYINLIPFVTTYPGDTMLFPVVYLKVADNSFLTQKIIFEYQVWYEKEIEQIDERQWQTTNLKLKSFATGLKMIRGNGVGLSDVINRKEEYNLLYFKIATLEDTTNAKAVSDIIIQDIMQNASYNQTQGQTMIILDEYSAFGSSSLSTLILQARSLRYSLVLSYQGIGDLVKMGDEFKNNVLNNSNTFIVHKVQEPEGAEELSKMFGTKKSVISTFQFGEDMKEGLNLTNIGSHRVGDQFLFNPNVIKKLNVGETIIKTIDVKHKYLIYCETQKIDLPIWSKKITVEKKFYDVITDWAQLEPSKILNKNENLERIYLCYLGVGKWNDDLTKLNRNVWLDGMAQSLKNKNYSALDLLSKIITNKKKEQITENEKRK